MIKTKAITEENLDLDLQNIPEEAFDRFAVHSKEELLQKLEESEKRIAEGNYLTLEELFERLDERKRRRQGYAD